MEHLPFTVDAALLQELGERLVGKPAIALAELIKNSYDADATQVVIRFDGDGISVLDNGDGMTEEQFRDFWMRIGSPHKVGRRHSDRLDRPLTGSKGVGRLAVQLLASQLELRTTAYPGGDIELFAAVNWEEAVKAEELTKATAAWTERVQTALYPGGTSHGTELRMRELHQLWSAQEFETLAREIWDLRPPFAGSSSGASDQVSFDVHLEAADDATTRRFSDQMSAVLGLWTARLRGKLKPDEGSGVRDRTVELAFEFAGEAQEVERYVVSDCHLEAVDFEIRVFNLRDRQPLGIKVQDARNYLAKFGGVHVYDSGFRLPYYGVDTDWLRIEMDHSHRISASKLLPEALQVHRGLNFLPTNSRLFGVVNVNTALEGRAAAERSAPRGALGIQVTRDRLREGEAYRDLVEITRWAMDYYAMREARRVAEAPEDLSPQPTRQRAARVEDVLTSYEDEIPAGVLETLREEISEVVAATESEAEHFSRQAGLLGALATAGMSALAYEHEAAKQVAELERVAEALPTAKTAKERASLAGRLEGWLAAARATRALFSHLQVEENQQQRKSLKAGAVVQQVAHQIEPLLGDLPIDPTGVDASLRLPPGRLPEWSALFQNLFLNAANAMLDSPHAAVYVRSEVRGRRRALYVEDVGSGVDLEEAEELFEPFVRRLEISRERRSLGLGGSGLGLTIVRMIAAQLGCTVEFVSPPAGRATSARIAWSQ